MEIEPRFVDVAVRRWQSVSGRDAIHAETRLSFDETADQHAGAASTAEPAPADQHAGAATTAEPAPADLR
jgi:heme-binding NEAT domain protein